MTIKRFENLNKEFRILEVALRDISFPENDFNKMMSLVLSNINSIELIQTRYEESRLLLKEVSESHRIFMRDNPQAKSFAAHPSDAYAHAAIRVDVESLFIFGLTLINKVILLLQFYLPDSKVLNKKGVSQYGSIAQFYKWLSGPYQLSDLAKVLKARIFSQAKWLYAVLRFYRNEFIEHVDKGYQQGMGYDSRSVEKFRLHAFGWQTGSPESNLEILDFKNLLIQRSVSLPTELNPRHYVQLMFDNIILIPDDLLEAALKLIEKNGIETPTAATLVGNIEKFSSEIFRFLASEIRNSALERYRKVPTSLELG